MGEKETVLREHERFFEQRVTGHFEMHYKEGRLLKIVRVEHERVKPERQE